MWGLGGDNVKAYLDRLGMVFRDVGMVLRNLEEGEVCVGAYIDTLGMILGDIGMGLRLLGYVLGNTRTGVHGVGACRDRVWMV